MQFRTIIDRMALWLSVAVLIGATVTGIFFSYIEDGSPPSLRQKFGAEIQKKIGEGDVYGALYQMKLAADFDPAQRAQMLQNRISFAWRIGDLKIQKEGMHEAATSGMVRDPAAYAGFALMLLEPYEATQGKEVKIDAETIELAIHYADRALELNPEYALAHYDLGVAWMLQNERKKAAEFFRKAVELDPRLSKAQLRLQQLEAGATAP